MKRWVPWIGFGVVILIVCLFAAQWVKAANTRRAQPSAAKAAVMPTEVSVPSVDSMQKQLLDPKLDVASRESLMEKIELQKKADANQQAGINNPAPKGQVNSALPQASKAMSQEQDSSGIYEGSDGIVKPDAGQINNYWQGKNGDVNVVVLAGALPDDATQGLVLVVTMGTAGQQGGVERYLTAEKTGSLHVVGVQGRQIILKDTSEAQVVFDLDKKSFVK